MSQCAHTYERRVATTNVHSCGQDLLTILSLKSFKFKLLVAHLTHLWRENAYSPSCAGGGGGARDRLTMYETYNVVLWDEV